MPEPPGRREQASAMATPDDAAIIEWSIRDPEAFAVPFDRHAATLHRYVARRLGQGIADDIVADTFLVAFSKRARYIPSAAGDARPWLYGIAANLIRKHTRSEVRMLRAYARTGADPVLTQQETTADDALSRVEGAAARRGRGREAGAADHAEAGVGEWGDIADTDSDADADATGRRHRQRDRIGHECGRLHRRGVRRYPYSGDHLRRHASQSTPAQPERAAGRCHHHRRGRRRTGRDAVGDVCHAAGARRAPHAERAGLLALLDRTGHYHGARPRRLTREIKRLAPRPHAVPANSRLGGRV